MRKAIKKILPLLFLLQLIYSCIADKDEFMDQIQNSNPVQIELSTRSFVEGGVTISKFRFIAVSALGRVVINQMIDNPADKNFTFSIAPGNYTLYAVANETVEMTQQLNDASTKDEVNRVQIPDVYQKSERWLPLAWIREGVIVKAREDNSSYGTVSFDNGVLWKNVINIELERLAAKLQLKLRRSNAKNKILLRAATFYSYPSFSYLYPLNYDGLFLGYDHMIDRDIEISSVDDGTENYTVIRSNYLIGELLGMGTPCYVKVTFLRDGVPETHKLSIGQSQRNKYYQLMGTITTSGVVIDNIVALPWGDATDNIDVSGVEIQFSKVEVPYSYETESNVHFVTKNIAEENIRLSDGLYSSDGTVVNVSSKFDMRKTKLTYSYDKTTGRGSGILTIKRKTAAVTSDTLLIYAAGLRRTIIVNGLGIAGSNVYWDELKQQLTFDNVPQKGKKAPHEHYQGVYFNYGGMVARSGGSNNQSSEIIWNASGSIYTASSDIPYLTDTDYPESMSNMPFSPNNDIGDICVFLSRRGIAPGSEKGMKWKTPTRDDWRAVISAKVKKTEGIWTDIGENSDWSGNTSLEQGVRIDDRYFFPASGSASVSGGYFQKGCYIRYMCSSPKSGKRMYTFQQDQDGSPFIHDGVFRNLNLIPVRCVVDDSPESIKPLYMLTYDIDEAHAGTTVSSGNIFIKKQYADAGSSITLSDQVLTSSDGRLHTGWVVDGKEYTLGAVISNVNKDLVVRPKWGPRSIN